MKQDGSHEVILVDPPKKTTPNQIYYNKFLLERNGCSDRYNNFMKLKTEEKCILTMVGYGWTLSYYKG